MVLLQRKLYYPKDPERVQHFPGGGGSNFFPGGGGGPLYIETHITCDFPGGGGEGSGPAIPPLVSKGILQYQTIGGMTIAY